MLQLLPKSARRFLLIFIGTMLVGSTILAWILASFLEYRLQQETYSQLRVLAGSLAQQIVRLPENINDSATSELVRKLAANEPHRYTVFDHQGKLIFDSTTSMQDRKGNTDRPELKDAIEGGVGYARRFSKSSMDKLLLVTVSCVAEGSEPVSNADSPDKQDEQEADSRAALGFVRAAVSDQRLRDSFRNMWLISFSILVATSMLLTGLVLWFAIRNLSPIRSFSYATKRIGKGYFDAGPSLLGRTDEWGQMADAFRQMQDKLESRENRMLENTARLEAVLRSMIEGVVAIDAQDTIMLANDAACHMLNMSRHDLIGKKLLQIVRFPELTRAVEQTRSQRTFSQVEFQTLGHNRRTISAGVAVLADPRGAVHELPGIALVFHDVTDLRQLETMRQDFVANVSHELKTPLSAIMAYAETLKLGALDDPSKNMHFLGQIEYQAQILNQQIQDLLQLARVETGREVWDIGAISINDVCSKSAERLMSMADKQGVRLTTSLSIEAPRANADADGLRTVVDNLISNAIHYTPSGGEVNVETAVAGNDVLIRVRDTGIGIAQEHHSRIFERFYRVDKARSRDMGGTGLGLAIVKHTIQSFSGSIELDSQVGRGTTFTVRLPRFSEAVVQPPGTNSPPV